MIIKEFAESVHQVAVDHGWHEGGKETHFLEYIAMIHCELSEALQEMRADKPLVWYDIYDKGDDCGGGGRCGVVVNEGICPGRSGKCKCHHKPEGVAVEMADAVLRILDFLVEMKMGYWQWESFDEMIADVPPDDLDVSFPVLIAKLHEATARAAAGGYLNFFLLEPVMAYACAWIQKQGLDCEALLMEKNEYNKTREYRHGGKKF